VKKMNGKTLEIEPGTIGYEQIDCAGMLRALNAWAKRRGIPWESRFNREFTYGRNAKKRRRP